MASDKMKAIYKVTDTHIYGFFDRHRYLSNYHLHPIEWEGIIYPANENAYHANKTSNPRSKQDLANCTPNTSKAMGRQLTLREDWLNELPLEDQVTDNQGALILQVRDKIMYDLNVLKFQDPELKTLLFLTEDLYLEETNWWRDDYWGVWEGNGLNKLGRILMMIRSELNKKEVA